MMAQAVDHTGGPEWNPHHLDRPDSDTDGAEQQKIDHTHDCHTQQRVRRVESAFDPVVRAVLAVDAQGLGVLRFGAIELGAFAQYGRQAFNDGTVWIVDGFAFGVVLAVDGGPLAGVLRRGQPQPEAEEVFQASIELQGAMG